jgi:hypothetical protein
MSQTRITIKGLAGLKRKLTPEMIGEPLRVFFTHSTRRMQERAKRNVPVDQGDLKHEIKQKVDDARVPGWAWMGVDAPEGSVTFLKARAMEFGTGSRGDPAVSHKATHFPPGPALDRWAHIHGFESGAQVAKIIGRRGGLEPRRYLRDALKQSMSDIKRFAVNMGNEIQRRFGR